MPGLFVLYIPEMSDWTEIWRIWRRRHRLKPFLNHLYSLAECRGHQGIVSMKRCT